MVGTCIVNSYLWKHGPFQLHLSLSQNQPIGLIDGTVEPEPKKAYDVNFGSNVMYFENQAIFYQKIESKTRASVSCIVNFMVCNDNMCFPPEDVIIEVEINK